MHFTWLRTYIPSATESSRAAKRCNLIMYQPSSNKEEDAVDNEEGE
jgi:hypothetical protein